MRKLKDLKSILGHDELLVAEFFKGYGSQSMSLDEIGIPNKVVVGSEIDPDAIISYASARFSQEELNKEIDLTDDKIKEYLMNKNIGWDFRKEKSSIPRMKKDKLHKLYNSCILTNEVGDISILNPKELPNFDLMTYSFPCTDISVAGKQEGLIKGQTRSGLLWECEKVIAEKKPKFLLMENVKNLVGKQFKPDFDRWCNWLEKQGYTNYWKVLNAKDYGVPQNRERVFMISILGEHDTYEFPQKQELKNRLKDVLESEVDEKYYIDTNASNRLLMALQEKGYTKNMVGIANNPDSREYTDFKECSPTLCARDYKDPKIVQTICEQRSDEGLRFFKDNICGTLRTIDSCGDKRVLEDNDTYRIRKLTPKECFRLMGVSDDKFDMISASGISNSQLYKQAGNSIVRNCLDAIFTELFFEKEKNF